MGIDESYACVLFFLQGGFETMDGWIVETTWVSQASLRFCKVDWRQWMDSQSGFETMDGCIVKNT